MLEASGEGYSNKQQLIVKPPVVSSKRYRRSICNKGRWSQTESGVFPSRMRIERQEMHRNAYKKKLHDKRLFVVSPSSIGGNTFKRCRKVARGDAA